MVGDNILSISLSKDKLFLLEKELKELRKNIIEKGGLQKQEIIQCHILKVRAEFINNLLKKEGINEYIDLIKSKNNEYELASTLKESETD